jgi:hypothetical protein
MRVLVVRAPKVDGGPASPVPVFGLAWLRQDRPLPARDHVVLPFTGPLMEVHRRAAVRGEIAATALTPRVTMVGPDLLLAHAIVDGPAASTAVVTEIVDLVLLPLLRGYASPST